MLLLQSGLRYRQTVTKENNCHGHCTSLVYILIHYVKVVVRELRGKVSHAHLAYTSSLLPYREYKRKRSGTIGGWTNFVSGTDPSRWWCFESLK